MVIQFTKAAKQVRRRRTHNTESPFLRLCRQFEHVTEGERDIVGDEPKELIARLLCDIIEDRNVIPIWSARAGRKTETPIRNAVNARLQELGAPELPGA